MARPTAAPKRPAPPATKPKLTPWLRSIGNRQWLLLAGLSAGCLCILGIVLWWAHNRDLASAADPQHPWAKACAATAAADGQPDCVIVQNVLYRATPVATPVPLMRAALGYFGAERQLRLILTLPATIRRDSGVMLQVDDTAPSAVALGACGPNECQLALAVDASAISNLTGHKRLLVSYDTSDGRRAILPIILDGLGDALKQISP